MPGVALGDLLLPCGTKGCPGVSSPVPAPMSPRGLGSTWATLAAPAPPCQGRMSRAVLPSPRQGVGREQAAPSGPVGLPQEHGAWGNAWQPQPQHTVEGRPGTRKLLRSHAHSTSTPKQGSQGAESPWALLGCLGRAWHVHKASPPALPVPPPHHGQPLAALPSPAARVPLGWTCVKNIKGCFAWRHPEDPSRACHGEQRHQGCVADAGTAPAAHIPVLALQRPLSTHQHPRSSPDQQHTARGTG